MPTSTLGLVCISLVDDGLAEAFYLFIHICYVFVYLCVVYFIDLIYLYIYTYIYIYIYIYILFIYVLCSFFSSCLFINLLIDIFILYYFI